MGAGGARAWGSQPDAAAATSFFDASGDAIHFKYDDISVPQIGLKSPRLLAKAIEPLLTAEEWSIAGHALETQNAWHIQTGAGAMNWSASVAAYDAAIGGAQADNLDGGVGDDILIGGAGADTLSGGTGSDTLIGNIGADNLEGGTGNDVLVGGEAAPAVAEVQPAALTPATPAGSGDAVFVDNGAARVVECWQADVSRGKTTDFFGAVNAREDESVVFSWIEWPDKATRDAGFAKVEALMQTDPRFKDRPAAFDGKRLIFGGFAPVVEL